MAKDLVSGRFGVSMTGFLLFEIVERRGSVSERPPTNYGRFYPAELMEWVSKK